MNFITYVVNKPQNFKKLKSVKQSFFGRGTDASVFLYNEKPNGLVHLILKLNDEYLIRTKLFSEYTSIPFDHYINVFFNLSSSTLFIEESLGAYLDVAIEYLQRAAKIQVERKKIALDTFIKLSEKYSGNADIIRLEYLSKESDEEVTLEYTSMLKFQKLKNDFEQIDFMSWRFNEFYASINMTGKVKVDNSQDEFLVKFLGELSNEI
jgi:hypothetical protein